MSEGELFITIVSLAIVVVHVVMFAIGFSTAEHVRVPWAGRTLLLSLLPAPLVLMPVLTTIAAKDVRDDPTYVGMYLLMGMAWSALSLFSLRLWGFQLADITQRRNPAVRIFIIMFALASALAFAGGNVGDGPGFHVVIFSALLGSMTLFGTLAFLSLTSRVRYRVLVDRDTGLALRTGLLLVAIGLVAGRGAAGTWVSSGATVRDFVIVTWPVLPVIALDAAMTTVTRSGDKPPSLLIDALLGLIYLSLACVLVAIWGLPP
ncbi:MAG TPA: hypothetical protein VK157_09035 [Phycisphaerales bacterium]|nr:hypothetical protein [Phycisphaerales bacterium]